MTFLKPDIWICILPDCEEVRENIGPKHPLKPFLINLLHWTWFVLLGSIIDQYINPAIGIHNLINHPFAIVFISQVSSYCHRLFGIRSLCLLEHVERVLRILVLLSLHIREGYGCTLLCKAVAEGAKQWHTARPIPESPPVTSATFPCKTFTLVLLLVCMHAMLGIPSQNMLCNISQLEMNS